MAPLNTLFRGARPLFQKSSNITFASTRTAFRNAQFQNAFARYTIRNVGRRFQSTEATAEVPAKGLFTRMWESPVGFKTVHFWYVAPFNNLDIKRTPVSVIR